MSIHPMYKPSENVRLNMLIEELLGEANRKYEELTEKELDRAIRLLTLDRLDRIARNLEKRCGGGTLIGSFIYQEYNTSVITASEYSRGYFWRGYQRF